MKVAAVVTLGLFLWTVASSAAVQGGKGSIEGVVLRSGDSSPIMSALVTLAPDSGNSGGATFFIRDGLTLKSDVAAPGLTTRTDEQGKFALTGLDPAVNYRLAVTANGYVRQEYGQQVFPGRGRAIRLDAGQALKDTNIALTPTGSIEGTVRAASGETLQDVRIRLLRYVFSGEGVKHLQLVASTSTNDIGKYRLYALTPGRYYLHAERVDMHADFSRSTTAPFAPAFYPDESDISHASILDIQPGVNRSGMDFSLSGDKLYRIHGQIVDGRTGRAIKEGSVLLELFDLSPGAIPGGDGNDRYLFKSTYSEDAGEFDFRDIPPGKYAIAGSAQGDEGGGLVLVQVNGDIKNLKLSFGSGTTISGTLQADGRVALSGTRIELRPNVLLDEGDAIESCTGLSPEFNSLTERTFKIEYLVPGDHRIDLRDSSIPEGTYIKEARYGATDALNQPFEISASDSRKLEIVLAAAGRVTGRLVNDKGSFVAGTVVMLIPNRLRNRTDLFKESVTGQDGGFEMRGIAPGDYKLFAWEAIELYSWFDPDVLRRFESQGHAVHISEGAAAAVEVRIIPFAK